MFQLITSCQSSCNTVFLKDSGFSLFSLFQDQRSPFWSFTSGFAAPVKRKRKDQAKEEREWRSFVFVDLLAISTGGVSFAGTTVIAGLTVTGATLSTPQRK